MHDELFLENNVISGPKRLKQINRICSFLSIDREPSEPQKPRYHMHILIKKVYGPLFFGTKLTYNVLVDKRKIYIHIEHTYRIDLKRVWHGLALIDHDGGVHDNADLLSHLGLNFRCLSRLKVVYFFIFCLAEKRLEIEGLSPHFFFFFSCFLSIKIKDRLIGTWDGTRIEALL